MRNYVWTILLFLSIGCAVDRHSDKKWPATIASIEGFSEENSKQVKEALENMNEVSGKEVLRFGEEPTLYPVSIRAVPSDPAYPKRLGFATKTSSECSIEIYPKAFQVEDGAAIESVIWHEMGHCGGLIHEEDPNSVMNKTAKGITQYSHTSISEFFSHLFSNTGL